MLFPSTVVSLCNTLRAPISFRASLLIYESSCYGFRATRKPRLANNMTFSIRRHLAAPRLTTKVINTGLENLQGHEKNSAGLLFMV